MKRATVLLFAVLAVPCPLAFSDGPVTHTIEGVVLDLSGASVPGAKVSLRFGKTSLSTATDSGGAFRLVVAATRARLQVEAVGFRPAAQEWSAPEGRKPASPLAIVLQPALVRQNVTVTATRFPAEASNLAVNVEVVTTSDIRTSPGLRTDDVLRAVTGFSLFRRSSSRLANPTTQGVSLRGLTASGASRALVQADGTPLNDPFGGWVYWSRIPRTALERVEVMRGGASDLYGADALSGVIQLFSVQPDESYFRVESYGGSQETGGFSLSGGVASGRWQLGASGEAATTAGYVPVAEAERGAVDRPAGSGYLTLRPSLRYTWRSTGMVFLRGATFGESRQNGTAPTGNNTRIRDLAVGADLSTAAGALALRADGGWQVFNQTFAAVAADRNSEQLTRSQRVPARQFGFSALWNHTLRGRHTVVLGSEGRSARGVTQELAFGASGPAARLEAGGRRRALAAFGSSHLELHPRWTLTLGGRLDHWLIADGESRSQPLAPPGSELITPFADRTETAFSPRAGLLYQVHPRVSLSAAAFRAFRAPTLNELYRGFRVSNVITQANPDLRAERLTGLEASLRLTPAASSEVRATFFWNDLNRPVANRTLLSTPSLITRRRENLGRLRSTGLEIEAAVPLREHLRLTGGYQFTHSVIESFPADPALEGLRVPQVPRHQVTIEARYTRPQSFAFSLRPRWSSSQFDDDRNIFLLRDFFLMDAMFSLPLRERVEVYLAGENVFGTRYDLGRTPVLTVGPPVQVRVGVRYDLRWQR
ncbi:MAG: TonB-dependent receptor [Acidobacteria bacterium]|nr:TonB-dependent receptor [Acidobacteriota bacterium]